MSSPLYAATCTRLEDRVVDIELVAQPAIDAHFPLSTFFGFAVVHESASAMVVRAGQSTSQWRPPLSGPLAGEVDVDTVIDLSAGDPAKHAVAARYVTAAGYTSADGWAPTLCQPDADGVHRTGVSQADPARRQASATLGRVRDAGAVLRVEVTDPRWLSHLEVGMRWDVYAFDDDAPLFL